MPAPTISISSNDLTAASLIPPVHKGFSCGQPNENPQFEWALSGTKPGNGMPFTAADVEEFEIYIIDLDAVGTAPRPTYVPNNFLHWGVQNIPNTFTEVIQNQPWTTEFIYATDYGSGDNINGYNGPCAPALHIFNIQVIARIKPDSIADFFTKNQPVPKEYGVKGIFRFTDDVDNLYVEPPTEDVSCGQLNCPQGTELIGDNCVETETTDVITSPTIYTVQQGMVADFYGDAGAKFFEDVEQYTYPLTLINGIIKDNNNIVPTTALTPDYTSLSDAWASGSTIIKGRLNLATVWAVGTCPPGDTCTGVQACPPYDQWIGFSDCVEAPVTGKYCIGIGADNFVKIKIDGTEIFTALFAQQPNFKSWWVLEVTLEAGPHVIELEGNNDSACAAFAAEIYQATAATLQTFSTQGQVDATVIFSTVDRIGSNFDIGSESGFICPEGFAYDSCDTGECVKITYSPIEETLCFYRVINCKDVNDTYLLDFASTETNPLYQNSVFELGGNATYFTDKCFRLIGLEVATQADVTNATVITDYGINNCNACDPSEEVESCENPGQFEYLAMAEGQAALTPGNIYEFDQLEGCYKYIGLTDTQPPLLFDVEISTDYETDDCIICIPCTILTNCATEAEITIRFDDSVTEIPELGDVIEIAGDAALLDQCWQLTGFQEDCVPDYIDITITEDKECDDCEVCRVKYQLTDCTDVTNTIIVNWDMSENDFPLDETLTYIFETVPGIDPLVCWTAVSLIQPPCDDLVPSTITIGNSDITSTYPDCDECNEPCYKIRDCETLLIVGYSSTTDLSAYAGQTIKWQTQAYLDTNPDPIEWNCGIVEKYICRLETHTPIVDVYVEDCYKTCEECEYVAPEPPEEEIETGRKQQPGYDVPDCETC